MNSDILGFIDTYKINKNVIISFTLGKYSDAFGFDQSLFDKKYYDAIYNLLESCEKWDEVVEEIDEKFSDIPHKIIDTLIFKTNGPFDILLTASTKNLDRKYNSEEYTEKIINYTRKHHTFSVKHQHMYLEDKYTFSLVLLSNKMIVSSCYITDSSILKINDIFNACCKMTESLNFTKIK
tara:strand:- start:2347 stop:2886 length:540 start_codon:yes stop_codon:yes gene_type:complete